MFKLWVSFWPKNLTFAKLLFVFSLVCLVFNKLILVYLPFIFKDIVNMFDGVFTLEMLASKRDYALYLLALFIGLKVVAQFFSDARDLSFSKIAQRVLRDVGLRVFEHMHKLSLSYHLSRKTGGLSRVIERGTKGIESFIRFTTFNLVPTAFEISLVAGIFIYVYAWPYAVVTIITLVFYVWYTTAVSRWRIGFVRLMNKEETQAQGKAIDSLLNFETVNYFTNEKLEARRFDKHLKVYEGFAFKNYGSLALLNTGQNVIMMLGLGIILAMGLTDLSNKIITLGDFVAMHALLLQVYIPLSFFGFAYRETKMALVNIEDMMTILDDDPDISDKPNSKSLVLKGGEISFENVKFSYKKELPIFDNVSFTVPAGSTLAIVGSSGAGKSTIVRLLYRFYEVGSGVIKIDGQNINDVTQESLRSSIGIVPQDTVLFNDTIGYNIAYGKAGATQAEIEKAAENANIDAFVKTLPEKYDTLVGERGLKLSGGEKQRVSIARTILENPSILIFDEATSALDTKNEKLIQNHLNKLSKNHTTVIIAHRLSTVVNADNIIVLGKGKIIESGTHKNLISKQGQYFDMWQRQKEKQEEKPKGKE